MKRTMLDMRESAVKCRAAGGRDLEKQSNYQLCPCLVRDGSLMSSKMDIHVHKYPFWRTFHIS